MTVQVKKWESEDWALGVASFIVDALPSAGSVVLTGGTAAERIYPLIADRDDDWSQIDVFFSDDRSVPPDDEASNFGMVERLLLEGIRPRAVHRMRGEDDPEVAARDYDSVVRQHAPKGFSLTLLGLGGDGHIASLPPGAPALNSGAAATWVYRTDGLKGITLTPRALLTSERILVMTAGDSKADAVWRFLRGEEPISQCPAKLLLEHPNVTLLADTEATSRL